ncbi:DNA repair protein RadA [Candidatus Peregrinibacteria bacterium]|nr:DNA repair protein RadA [Candidatus Peregrinibacteria bacterium]
MKTKTSYECEKCQYISPKWIGKCPSCENWNSFKEQDVKISKTPRKIEVKEAQSLSISETTKQERIKTNIEEFDRIMGNGIVPGSLTLLTGEPGIGKSTLTLQIANRIAASKKTLIISGEESVGQIAARAQRLKLNEKNLKAINEFNLESALESIRSEKAEFVIIDSIQVISSMDIQSSAGSINQIRYCTEQIMELAKTKNIPVILIGHVTKEGSLAGPRVLEHLVDTVVHFEGDRFQQFRMLRAAKNRFGSCSEVGIFEMTGEGLKEVKNPSEQFLEGRKKGAIGSCITVAIEGTRPFLVEVQALSSVSPFGYPKRASNGFDLNRLQILVAVLEKHAKLNLQNQDIFINIVGGIKLSEPAADLAVLMAIASSFLKKPIHENSVIFGEVGLSGELRKVSHSDKRNKESQKMGFEKIISSGQFKEISTALQILN